MSPSGSTASSAWRVMRWLPVALILAAGWFVYAPALHGGWLWDDRLDLVENTLLRDTAGLWKIWTEPALLYDFYPIKNTVQWVQWQLWGNVTFGYHLTNLALHLLGAFLLWRVLSQLGVTRAWLGALLFTVHPLMLESVAWIAELKNTLSLPPLLLAFSAFIEFDARGRRRDYVAALLWFLVAMLCKTSVVMFPPALLLFLWWRKGRLGPADVKSTAPFFIVALGLGLVTVWFQQHRGIAGETIVIGGPLARLALAGTSGAFYLGRSLWPALLLPIYPQWTVDPPAWWHAGPWLVAGAAGAWAWMRRATWGRHALFGFGWFALHLAPFLGLVTISYMRFTWVQDHFTYVALPGLIALALAALGRAPAPRATTAGLLAICALLAWQARLGAAKYRNEEAFWTHTVRFNPGAPHAHYNLGVQLGLRGDSAAARAHYETAIRLDPANAPARNNLGVILRDAGDSGGALREWEEALRLQPGFADAHSNLGNLQRELGRLSEAILHGETAVRLDPRSASARNNFALALGAAGRAEDAIPQFQEALRLDPCYFEVHSNLAILLRGLNRPTEAMTHYREALRLKPHSPLVHFNCGNLHRQLGQLPAAVASYQEALRYDANLGAAHRNLALTLHELGRDPEARTHYDRARQIDPTLPAWPY